MSSTYLADIQQAILAGTWRISVHAQAELLNDLLVGPEVMASITANGQMIEYYPSTGRGPSCLILSWISPQEPVHTVIAYPAYGITSVAIMVTVYRPNLRPQEWSSDFCTRM
jgi:hypothetical protein